MLVTDKLNIQVNKSITCMARSLLNFLWFNTELMNSSLVTDPSPSRSISNQVLSVMSSSVPARLGFWDLFMIPDMSSTSFFSSDFEMTPLLSTSNIRNILKRCQHSTEKSHYLFGNLP